jgi:hypothetical protein
MSALSENPELMLEVLAILVRKAGGHVIIGRADAPGPFNLMSRVTPDNKLELLLKEGAEA